MTTHPVGLLLVGLWFGLATGIGEALVLGLKRLAFHRLTHVSVHVVWMAPVANVCLFGLLGLVLAVVARRWPERMTLGRATSIFAFFAFLSASFLYHPLHVYAKLLLAAGLAVQTGRVVAAYPGPFCRLVEWTLVWIRPVTGLLGPRESGEKPPGPRSGVLLTHRQFLCGVGATIAGLALGTQAWQVAGRHRAGTRIATAPSRGPNVLLIVLDTVRTQNLSVYGYARRTTPYLERWAQKGVRFERAFSTAPWTLPSHVSILTGRFPHETSANWLTPMAGGHPTLADLLSAQGYTTAAFVANARYCSRETGLNRGFAHYEDYRVSPTRIALSASLGRAANEWVPKLTGGRGVFERTTAAEINSSFLAWLSKEQPRPFFVFLNYYDAHAPYQPPASFEPKFGGEGRRSTPAWLYREVISPEQLRREEVSADAAQAMVDGYDDCIAYVDREIEGVLGELERRDLLTNTLVIVTSDHGEEFGEHGLFGHGNSLYRSLVEVPLILALPSRVPEGVSVRAPVSLRDLPATVLDLLHPGRGAGLPGESLGRYWRNGDSDGGAGGMLLTEVSRAGAMPSESPVSRGGMRSLVLGGWRYIGTEDGREELYDFENDPLEARDLSRSAEAPRALEMFRATLRGRRRLGAA